VFRVFRAFRRFGASSHLPQGEITVHIALGSTPEDTLAAFTARAAEDPAVAGLVLSGSRVHEGMPTGHSDYDLHVILRDGQASELAGLDWFRSAHLEILGDGDPSTQRALFTGIEEAARDAGHGTVLDSWGTDLDLLRHS
jgi:hypothetical protein